MCPDVVTRSQNISTGIEQLLGGTRGRAQTTCSFLCINNDKVGMLCRPQFGQEDADCLPPRFADYITDCQYYHQPSSLTGKGLPGGSPPETGRKQDYLA